MRMGELTKNKEVMDGGFEDLGIYIQQIFRENSLTKELLRIQLYLDINLNFMIYNVMSMYMKNSSKHKHEGI